MPLSAFRGFWIGSFRSPKSRHLAYFCPFPTVLATWQMPLQFVTKRMLDKRDRAEVNAIYDELQTTGKVEEHLPEHDRSVRDLFYADWPELAPPGYESPLASENEAGSGSH